MGLMESFENSGAECSGNKEATAVDEEVIIHTKVALRTPELLQVKREVTFVVRKSCLNELQEVLVLTVIAGMVLEFLKAKVVTIYGPEFS